MLWRRVYDIPSGKDSYEETACNRIKRSMSHILRWDDEYDFPAFDGFVATGNAYVARGGSSEARARLR